MQKPVTLLVTNLHRSAEETPFYLWTQWNTVSSYLALLAAVTVGHQCEQE
ncbi:MAG: hypothetical protein HYX94_10755 [Chloroflexi bacterium]|nr:hypothetical protein [Chloroflexota bacterium]